MNKSDQSRIDAQKSKYQFSNVKEILYVGTTLLAIFMGLLLITGYGYRLGWSYVFNYSLDWSNASIFDLRLDGLYVFEKYVYKLGLYISFFAVGIFAGYLVLPIAIEVLLSFTPSSLTNLVKFDDYLTFVTQLILVFGIAFELPVFLIALNLAGILSGRSILRPWRYAIFGITLFSAIATPTGDPITLFFLAGPLILLYLAAGGISLLIDKSRLKRKNRSE